MRTVQRPIYITEDGTEFLSKKEADVYEQRQRVVKLVQNQLPPYDNNHDDVVQFIIDNQRRLMDILADGRIML